MMFKHHIFYGNGSQICFQMKIKLIFYMKKIVSVTYRLKVGGQRFRSASHISQKRFARQRLAVSAPDIGRPAQWRHAGNPIVRAWTTPRPGRFPIKFQKKPQERRPRLYRGGTIA